MIEVVATDKAPAAVGPYSQALVVQGFVYCSGQIGLNTKGELQGGLHGQVQQIFKNIRAVLAAAGSSLDLVVKTTVFLKYIDDYGTVNELYAAEFGETKPARSAVEVGNLPRGGLVEIECVAVTKRSKK